VDALPSTQNAWRQEATATGFDALIMRYNDAVRDVTPFYPILSYRLTADPIVVLRTFIKGYYERVRQRPDVTNDPQAPVVLAAMEEKRRRRWISPSRKH
jgi:hypothetical protein